MRSRKQDSGHLRSVTPLGEENHQKHLKNHTVGRLASRRARLRRVDEGRRFHGNVLHLHVGLDLLLRFFQLAVLTEGKSVEGNLLTLHSQSVNDHLHSKVRKLEMKECSKKYENSRHCERRVTRYHYGNHNAHATGNGVHQKESTHRANQNGPLVVRHGHDR